MTRLVRNPRVWLVAQMAVITAGLWGAGLLVVRQRNDTPSYLETSRLPAAQMLRSTRTVGYPLLLKAVEPFSPDFRLVPWLQLAAHFLGVGFLELAMRRFGASPWQAFAVATGFLYTPLNDLGVSYLLTDSLGKTLAVVTVGFLFWTSAWPRRWLPWVGLTIALACTYHVRPAYLFLVALVPVLGIMLLRLQTARQGKPFRWKAFALGLASAGLAPYLGFCLLRLVVVGHFGLVSFAGCNIIGITAEWLDEKMIATELPEQWRPLATEILQERRRLGLQSPYRESGIDLYVWSGNYVANAMDVAYPSAQRLYGDDNVVLDRQLLGLSQAVLRVRKAAYLRFLLYNLREGLARFLQSGFVLQVFLVLGFLAFCVRVLLRPEGYEPPAGWAPAAGGTVMHGLLLAGVSFAAAKLLLVALLEITIARYVYAAGVLLPSICVLWIVEEVERIRTPAGACQPAQSERR